MPDQVFSDVKVLDLTHYIAGPYCTKIFADYGADVLKIERPGVGDGARRIGPFYKDDPHPEKSGPFLYLNTNKRGITLNLKSDTGKKIFRELVKDVDILVENFSPRVMPSLGLDYATLEKINPKLVMTSISNFGQTGPYRDYKASETIEYGMGGFMIGTGLPEREPVKLGGNVEQYQAGLVAAEATMIALFGARLQGIGQQVDISIMRVLLGSPDRRALSLVGAGYNPGEVSSRSMIGGYPMGGFPCKDGYEWIIGGLVRWREICTMIDRPDLATDPRFCTPAGQASPEGREAFMEIFLPWCLEHTMEEITIKGQSTRNLVMGINTTKDLVEHPQMKERGFFVEIDHPVAGKLEYPGASIKMIGTPFQVRMPAPLLGQHNEEVYGQLGYIKEDLVKLRERGVI